MTVPRDSRQGSAVVALQRAIQAGDPDEISNRLGALNNSVSTTQYRWDPEVVAIRASALRVLAAHDPERYGSMATETSAMLETKQRAGIYTAEEGPVPSTVKPQIPTYLYVAAGVGVLGLAVLMLRKGSRDD